MQVLYFVLLLLAVVCFLAAAFEVAVRRLNLVAFGLALWAAVSLLQVLQSL